MKKQISFIIRGNQEKPDGNPIPYCRITAASKFRKDSMRYYKWKEFVCAEFITATFGTNFAGILEAIRVKNRQKPIELEKGQKAIMDLTIYWKDEKHGDPDNIFKGIADALFQDDKNLDGSFKSSVSGKGSVYVKIKIL